jgi:hypothetical protein
MLRLSRPVLLVAFLLATVVVAQKPAIPAGELKKLRVLVVLDTVSNLERQLRVDEGRLVGLLADNVPPERLDVKVLKDRKATRAEVLKYYRTLKTGPDEALFFFYGGHGAIDPKKGHYLALQDNNPGQQLVRTELRKAMQAKKAGLVVIVTDCCANTVPLPKFPQSEKKMEDSAEKDMPRIVLHPMLRALFFEARGVVDITAARNNYSWGDDDGGVFTRSFCSQLLRYANPRAARVATWGTFFPVLQKQTVVTFKGWARKVDPKGRTVKVKDPPVPHKFVIDEKPSRAAPAAPAGKAFVVVSLQNKKPVEGTYRWRWPGEERWKTERLEPGATRFHTREVPASGEMPLLQVELAGQFHKVQGKLFKGNGKPAFTDGRLYYIKPSPPDKKDNKEP